MHGDATPPPIFSIKGFGYARWLSHNKKHVEDSKHQFNMAGGTEPVRGEKSFSRSTMRGFSGPWSGQAAVVSGPQEWQTTTNLGAGFNPNVAGGPPPVSSAARWCLCGLRFKNRSRYSRALGEYRAFWARCGSDTHRSSHVES